MNLRSTAGFGAAVLVIAVAGTAPASADQSEGFPGVSGYVNTTNNTLTVSDTACDDDSVYAQWHSIGGKNQTIKNTLGCGHSKTGSVPMGNGTVIEWKVCIDGTLIHSDRCSVWYRTTM